GLIRVTFELPANVKLIDPATSEPSVETFVDVWRSVPTVHEWKITGQAGGHPAPQFLDGLHSFQRVLFTNSRVRALADAMDAGTTPLPDPDAPLSPLEQQGKVVFTRACAQCHGGPRMSTPAVPVIRYHDVAAGCPRPVDTAMPPR